MCIALWTIGRLRSPGQSANSGDGRVAVHFRDQGPGIVVLEVATLRLVAKPTDHILVRGTIEKINHAHQDGVDGWRRFETRSASAMHIAEPTVAKARVFTLNDASWPRTTKSTRTAVFRAQLEVRGVSGYAKQYARRINDRRKRGLLAPLDCAGCGRLLIGPIGPRVSWRFVENRKSTWPKEAKLFTNFVDPSASVGYPPVLGESGPMSFAQT